jgi:hypothetical protein
MYTKGVVMSFGLPQGFQFTHGDSIHTSGDTRPHLTGSVDGQTVHVPYYGQTTLGMFDRDLPGHRLGDVERLHAANQILFRDSGLGS